MSAATASFQQMRNDSDRRVFWPQQLQRGALMHLTKTEARKRRHTSEPADAAASAEEVVGSPATTTTSTHATTATKSAATRMTSTKSGGAAASHPSTSAPPRRPAWLTSGCGVPLRRINVAPLPEAYLTDPTVLPPNACASVVAADIARSLFTVEDETLRAALRKLLQRAMLRVFVTDKSLHYYQGFHDIASCFMHVYVDDIILRYRGDPETLYARLTDAKLEYDLSATLLRLARTRLSRFCATSMGDSCQMLVAVHAVVQQEHPRLACAIERHGLGPACHFALPWVITWFAHSVSDPVQIRAIFDFLVSSDEHAVLYLSVALLMHYCTSPAWLAHYEEGGAGEGAMMYMELKSLPQRLQPPAGSSTAHATHPHLTHRRSSGVGSLDAMHQFFGPAPTTRSESPAQALQFIIADARVFSRRYKALVLAALEAPESVVPISTLPPLARWSSASSSPRLSFAASSHEASAAAVSAVRDAGLASPGSVSEMGSATASMTPGGGKKGKRSRVRHPGVTAAAAAAGAAVGVSGSALAAAGSVLTQRREARERKRQARQERRDARQAANAAAPRPVKVGTPASTLRKWIGALVVTAVALQAPSVIGGAAAAAPFLL